MKIKIHCYHKSVTCPCSCCCPCLSLCGATCGGCGILGILCTVYLQVLVLGLSGEGEIIDIFTHRYSSRVNFNHPILDHIVHCLIVMNCLISSASLGFHQDKTAGNESCQTGHKQQGIGSCDGCYHNRWIGGVRAFCTSIRYCKEMEIVRG